MAETFKSIREKGQLLYEYIRGSHSQGTNTETSDLDTGGVFMSPAENLLDLGIHYKDQVESSKHDDVWYELNKFMRLLLTSNPTMLESLFIDDEFILYEHPIITEIKKHRDKFVTKACFKPMFGFAKSQIEKMRGLNKKIVNPIVERKKPLDFAFTFRKQGSTKIEYWLEHRGMKQKYCGLVNIPNMDCMYAVFYDWGNHFLNEGIDVKMLEKAYYNTNEEDAVQLVHMLKTNTTCSSKTSDTRSLKTSEELLQELEFVQLGNMARFIVESYLNEFAFEADPYTGKSPFEVWFENQKPIGYKGMISQEKDSNELKLSSVEKDVEPICHMHYDKDKYSSHCREYKEYQTWVKERNPVRYESNLNKNYDAKNASHCVRIINMCIEIASGKGFNVNRRNIDREFLLDIKNHKYEYDDLMKIIEEKEKEMADAIATSTLPDKIDVEFVNDLLLNIRKKQIKSDFV